MIIFVNTFAVLVHMFLFFMSSLASWVYRIDLFLLNIAAIAKMEQYVRC